jgi:hypothetical protein
LTGLETSGAVTFLADVIAIVWILIYITPRNRQEPLLPIMMWMKINSGKK